MIALHETESSSSKRASASAAVSRRGHRSAAIRYTVANSPLGCLLLGATERGICTVLLGDDAAALEDRLRADHPAAQVDRDDNGLRNWMDELIRHLRGERAHLELPLDIQGTAFQRRVWQELQSIPYGNTRSYREVAAAIGQPTAVRAVARACATNPVGLIIPCHRVIRGDGTLGGYYWGLDRKQALLAQEKASAMAVRS